MLRWPCINKNSLSAVWGSSVERRPITCVEAAWAQCVAAEEKQYKKLKHADVTACRFHENKRDMVGNHEKVETPWIIKLIRFNTFRGNPTGRDSHTGYHGRGWERETTSLVFF